MERESPEYLKAVGILREIAKCPREIRALNLIERKLKGYHAISHVMRGAAMTQTAWAAYCEYAGEEDEEVLRANGIAPKEFYAVPVEEDDNSYKDLHKRLQKEFYAPPIRADEDK